MFTLNLSPASPAELKEFLSILKESGFSFAAPIVSTPAPAIRPPSQSPDRERELRDEYAKRYGKGFSMKGRDGEGTALEILERLSSNGWMQGKAAEDENDSLPPVLPAVDDWH